MHSVRGSSSSILFKSLAWSIRVTTWTDRWRLGETSFAIGLATHRDKVQLLAIRKKEYAPRVPAERRGRMTDPSKTLRLTAGFLSDSWLLDKLWRMACQWAGGGVAEGFSLRGDKIHQAKLNAKGKWRNSVLVQLCTQVKRRLVPDRIHTTVPSAFEFPASRKTFHELESSSLEEMKWCVLDVEVWYDICARSVSVIFKVKATATKKI